MNLNSNSYFSQAPSVRLTRSAIDRSHTHKTSFNNGSLVPIYVDEILPGDSVSLDLSSVVRMSTPIKPIMDNIIMDIYFFFIPNRLVWNHWKAFMGEVDNGWTTNPTTYSIPQLFAPYSDSDEAVWYKEIPDFNSSQFLAYKSALSAGTYIGQPIYEGLSSSPYYSKVTTSSSWNGSAKYYKRYAGFSPYSLAAYMGFPIGANAKTLDESGNDVYTSMSALPFRAYAAVWNEFFRDQNYMPRCNDGYSSDTGISGHDALQGDHWTGSNILGEAPTSTYDYVTDTIKGAKPLSVSRFHDYFSSALPKPQRGIAAQVPLSFSGLAPVLTSSTQQSWSSTDPRASLKWKNVNGSPSTLSNKDLIGLNSSLGSVNYTLTDPSVVSSSGVYITPSNLYADVESVVSAGTINDLRTAFQVQKFLETYARSGARYTEIIQGFFGVKNPDARLQRPEFLGYKRNYINVSQVLQTSSTDATTPQGNTAAYSLTTNKDSIFTKSFTEHGILLGLCCTRTSRSYQSGINKMWSRRKKYDYYWPQFAHLGEEPIINKEIFCYTAADTTGSKEYLRGVFGYQERYAEYRYFPDIITGDFSSYSPQSLDLWHFGDYYDDAVYLNQDWLFEGPQNVDRTLAVTSSLSHQFIADFYFKAKYVRPMPLYSIPGLSDHF